MKSAVKLIKLIKSLMKFAMKSNEIHSEIHNEIQKRKTTYLETVTLLGYGTFSKQSWYPVSYLKEIRDLYYAV